MIRERSFKCNCNASDIMLEAKEGAGCLKVQHGVAFTIFGPFNWPHVKLFMHKYSSRDSEIN